MKEVGERQLKIVGTGFYVTRYGLFITAKHVLEDLANDDGMTLHRSFICHLAPENAVYFRPIRKAHLHGTVDIGIAQADNFLAANSNPLMNLRPTLSSVLPADGSPLTTYAYPENDILNFNIEGHVPEIRGDYFQGGFLRYISKSENPFMPYPYIETSIELRSGASGGPVFNSQGCIIGINCRGWDFGGAEHEGNHLSSIVPISFILDLPVDPFLVPPFSWEAKQIPPERTGQLLTCRDLVRYGHIQISPPLP